jgi:tRNA 2-thiocytidine biosynthesis protein TtcA
LQRQAMKEMLATWQQKNPLWIKSMFTAMGNIKPSHMMDRGLFDFANNEMRAPEGAFSGDIMFDKDESISLDGVDGAFAIQSEVLKRAP